MTSEKQCDTKHKNINWLITIIFTILTLVWAVMIPTNVYLYNITATASENAVNVQTELKIEINKYEYLVQSIKEFKDSLEKFRTENKQDMKEVNTKLAELDKKISSHTSDKITASYEKPK